MRLSLIVTSLALTSLAACSGGGEAPKAPAAPTTAAPAPKTEAPATAAPTAAATQAAAPASDAAGQAAEIFTQRCTTCHGADGSGNGPAAAALNPKPRNYSDAAWQAATTDEKISQAIVKGGPAVGLSPLMPPNPDLETKPEIVAELVKKIRSFKK